MRICRVQIDNYRNLRHVDVEFGSIMALIGENNSGKTNFLRALSIPLSSDDTNVPKRLTWYDINMEAKKHYYAFLKANRDSIVNGSMPLEKFLAIVPIVRIQLYLQPENNEHYNVNDILINHGNWMGGILYQFFVNKPEELLDRVRTILTNEPDDNVVQLSLLPMELFDYSITVPGKGTRVPYDVLSKFRSVALPAERDSFASGSDRLGSKALADLLQRGMTADSKVKIEKAYNEFFNTVKTEGKMDAVLNWQEYSDIENAQAFFQHISILPNMPQMSSILGSIRLGYDEENMYFQGLGHRNLILLTVLVYSYINKERDVSFRLLTVEEPEAHLCVSNTLLMSSLLDICSRKNSYTQIVFSTHNAELVNKLGLQKVIVFHNGEVFALNTELTEVECKYLVANPNTDIFKILYSQRVILVEGITEELLIKSYLQTRQDLNNIKVLSFHKGFTKIIDIWKKVNAGSDNKLGVVRDYDDEPKAQKEHEDRQNVNVMVRTTKGYTLETDITYANYELIKEKYGRQYGWSNMTAEELQQDWREKKSDVMLQICHDLVEGELVDFILPAHIQDIIDFMQGVAHEG